MKKIISSLLVVITLFSVLSTFSISASAATCIFPRSSYPSASNTSESCTCTLTSKKKASVYVWAYSNKKNTSINIRMINPTNNKVIWSEKNSFKCSKIYMYAFYQGGRTYYLGSDHKSYKLQFSGKNLSALYVRNPSKCTIK